MKKCSIIFLAMAFFVLASATGWGQSTIYTESFDGFTTGARIGTFPGWIDAGTTAGYSPTIGGTNGVAGSKGLTKASQMFAWPGQTFNWNDADLQKVTMQMDFMTSATSTRFDDDRLGWMIRPSIVHSDSIFGVQLDPGGTGLNIEGYWFNSAGSAKVSPSIVSLPTLAASTWYRFRVEFTKLTLTSVRIDVSLTLLDASGNPSTVVATGSIPNTNDLGANAPHARYFTPKTMYPGFKNYDGQEGAADNAYFEVTPMVPAGATWKYLDNGSNQGTAWRALGFDDGAWKFGPARLGYGGDGEMTTVSYGSDAANKYVTTYFRRTFNVPNPSVYSGLNLSAIRDDGAVVYLNGTEVFRSNMPEGAIAYNTLAPTAVGTTDELAFFSTTVDPSLLLSGSNVLAVEIHQNTVSSTDLGFDLKLIGTIAIPTITTVSTLTAFSTQPGVPSAAQSYTVSGSNLTEDLVITAPTGFEISTDDGANYFSTRTLPESGGSVASTTVYARLTGATEGTFSGNITHVSSGAATQNIAVSGTVSVIYTLTADNDGHGAVTLSPAGGTYSSGTTVTLSPVPSSGYAFYAWSGANAGDVINTGGVYTIVMNGNKSITASFIATTTASPVASEDTYMSSGNPTWNYGSVVTLKSTVNSGGTNRGALLKWDLSSVPSNAVVTGVSMKLYVSTASTQTYNLYTMRRSWIEGTNASGAASTTSANWSTYDGINAWGTVGAANTSSDRYNTNLWGAGSTSFASAGNTTLALNSDGIAVVQGWIDGTATNYGLTVQNYSTTSGSDDLQFASSENTTEANRPVLEITYYLSTVPTVTTNGTLAPFSSQVGVPSPAQTYTVSGGNLTADITVTAPTGFQISTDGSTYSSGLTLSPAGGSISPTTIYVQLNSATEGAFSGNITHASLGAGTKIVAVNGTVDNDVTVTFQYGVSAYMGTDDAFIRGTTEGNINFGTDLGLEWDENSGTTTDEITLIRFRDVFESSGGPVPDGATINSASLTYMTTDLGSALGGAANVYENLVDWLGSTVTYNNFGGDAGVQADEYNPSLVASATAGAISTQYSIDVTASVQRWSEGTANFGWIFLPTTDDGVTVYSSDFTTSSYRPRLTVVYEYGTGPVAPPVAPTSLTATATAGSQINLAWTDNSDNESSFVIERSTNGGAFSSLATVGPNSVAYTNEGLTAATDYCYRVRARNARGNSDWTSTACASTPSNPNNAIRFGASSAYVTFGNTSTLGLAQFTIETWFKREGDGTTTNTGTYGMYAVPLLTKGRGEAEATNVDLNYFLGIRASDNVIAADFEEAPGGPNDDGQNHPVYGTTAIVNGEWNHAAATFDGTEWKLYLNGNLEATLNTLGAQPRSDCIQHAGLATAMNSGGVTEGFFNGILDEARIWNYARTQAEIQATRGQQVFTATGLVARWGLDEGSGAVAHSSAATTIDGAVTGTGWTWVTGAPMTINQSPFAPSLLNPLNASTGVSTSPSLQLSVSDPESDAMTVTFYGRPKTSVVPDFTIIALPDAQNYTTPAIGGTLEMFTDQTEWIVAQRTAMNIVFATQEGDVTNNNTDAEWAKGSTAMGILETPEPGVPYGIAIGNHDVPGASLLNNYFPPTRFGGRAYYRGCYTDGDYTHNYQFFSASGMDFIVIHFGGGQNAPSTGVLEWADALLKTNSTRRGIVVNHSIIGTGNPASFSTAGSTIFNALKDNPNFFLMLCGHVHGEGRRTDAGDDAHAIHTILSDYQDDGGGKGWLRILKFSPNTDKITVSSYSPYIPQSNWLAAAPFDLDYPMDGAASYTILGTNTGVASGSSTSISWPGLTNSAEYEWYATVSDGHTTTTGATWSFTTEAVPSGQTITAAQPNTKYDALTAGVSMNFATLPAGGGNVTIMRHDAEPSGTYAVPPGGAAYIPVWLEITSTIPNYSFAVDVTLNVSTVGDFDGNSAVMFYNATTASWVPMAGTYAAGPPSTFSFTTTHFTPFAFVTKPATAYNLFVGSSGAATSAGLVTPNNTWRSGTPPVGGYNGPDDWSWTGSQSLTFYLVPQAGTVFKEADVMLEWDNTIMTYLGTAMTGITFTTVDTVLQPGGDQLKVHVTGAGDITANNYIAAVHFSLLKPGHSHLAVVSSDFTKDPSASVFVTPYQGEVKAYIGDVASAGSVLSQGDGRIDGNDFGVWTGSYWSGVPGGPDLTNYMRKYDIGPTEGGYVYGLPAPDLKIDFEDLVMFSVSYGLSTQHHLPKVPTESKVPMVIASGAPAGAGAETRIPISVSGGVADLRAMSLVLSGRFGKFLGAEKGALLQPYSTPVMILSRVEGSRVHVDMAIMGSDVEALHAEGEVLVLRFEGASSLGISNAQCRTSLNDAIALEVKNTIAAVPTTFGLSQNYPNPFNPSTILEYQIPQAAQVEISVFNLLGERVVTLVNEVMEPGYHKVTWNGTGASGLTVATGMYFYKMHAGEFVSTKRMLLIK